MVDNKVLIRRPAKSRKGLIDVRKLVWFSDKSILLVKLSADGANPYNCIT